MLWRHYTIPTVIHSCGPFLECYQPNDTYNYRQHEGYIKWGILYRSTCNHLFCILKLSLVVFIFPLTHIRQPFKLHLIRRHFLSGILYYVIYNTYEGTVEMVWHILCKITIWRLKSSLSSWRYYTFLKKKFKYGFGYSYCLRSTFVRTV